MTNTSDAADNFVRSAPLPTRLVPPMTDAEKLPTVISETIPLECTFGMIKSHVLLSPPIVGEIFYGLMAAHIDVAVACRVDLDRQRIRALYNEHLKADYFPALEKSVSYGVIVMALRGADVIRRWRAMLGPTNSMVAPGDTLRGLYGSRTVVADNVAHGSDSLAAARRELALFFPQRIQLWPAG